MNEKKRKENYLDDFLKKIAGKKKPDPDRKDGFLWLQVFGIIGWSVIVPSLLGIGLGIWIDRSFRTKFSFTLMLMFGGLMLGCFNAWNWLKKYFNGKDK